MMIIKSQSHLPDIVNDCESKFQRQDFNSLTEDHMKITCKQIAHSLRLVADQVDQKYCQVSDKYHFFFNKYFFFVFSGY